MKSTYANKCNLEIEISFKQKITQKSENTNNHFISWFFSPTYPPVLETVITEGFIGEFN